MAVDSLLHDATGVALGLSECGTVSPGRIEEEVEPHFTIVFPLSGVFTVDVRGNPAVAAPARALFFSRGDTQRITHPSGGHDRSAYISMSPDVVWPYVDGSGAFGRSTSPTTPDIDMAIQRLLVRAAMRHLTSLELEEFVHHALGSLVVDSLAEVAVAAIHRRLAADADEYLAVHFGEQADLATIAHNVGASPHHLSRVFKRVTGQGLARRRTRLRLAYVLSQILGGAEDLSTVAVEAGFYDHSHMTNSFKAHFGLNPEEARSRAAGFVGEPSELAAR